MKNKLKPAGETTHKRDDKQTKYKYIKANLAFLAETIQILLNTERTSAKIPKRIKTSKMESQKRTKSPSPSPTRRSTRREGSSGVSPSPTSSSRIRTGSTGVGKVNIRQNFSEESESRLNGLANLLMIGGYQCLAMASYFDRDEVGLYGVAHFSK